MACRENQFRQFTLYRALSDEQYLSIFPERRTSTLLFIAIYSIVFRGAPRNRSGRLAITRGELRTRFHYERRTYVASRTPLDVQYTPQSRAEKCNQSKIAPNRSDSKSISPVSLQLPLAFRFAQESTCIKSPIHPLPQSSSAKGVYGEVFEGVRQEVSARENIWRDVVRKTSMAQGTKKTFP
ncbi:hypothetical protein DBV15_05806 [Temnothorax longispinosus]|uniref:Uncharacterized protein n=1 Tax=Temnothorax longispinosus TaxID=300112 RepID=A0A4S2LAF1_9HYME|nr:hypothetical protein DBV15_05806 [Temnothorax longispinosus]